MTTEDARDQYAAVASSLLDSVAQHMTRRFPAPSWRCPSCHWLGREIEAASLALDLAVAEASRQRTRETVAW